MPNHCRLAELEAATRKTARFPAVSKAAGTVSLMVPMLSSPLAVVTS